MTFSCLVSLDGEHSENSCASLAEVTVGQDETMSADPTASERPPNKSWCSVYPSLASWLDGVGDNHPIVELSYNREAFDGFAAPLETIISRLELAAPLRLPGRRKAFRTNVQQFLDLRVELNAAFHVARAEIPFTFGKEGGNVDSEPDFHCEMDGVPVHIEVTAKSPNGVRDLHDDLESALIDSDVYVTLNVPSILRISTEARKAAVQAIVDAVERMTEVTTSVSLPNGTGSALLEKPSPFGDTHVMWMHDFGTDIGPSEEMLREAVLEKKEQSLMGSWPRETLLVIDGARLGHAVWLRPTEVWAGCLPQLDFEWETLPLLGVAVVISSLTTVGFQGAAAPRPGLNSTELGLFNNLTQRLGLLTVPS